MIPGVRERGSCAGRQRGAERVPLCLFLQQQWSSSEKGEGRESVQSSEQTEEKSSRREVGIEKAKGRQASFRGCFLFFRGCHHVCDVLSAPSLLSGLCMQRQEGDQAGAAESHFNTEQRRPKRKETA